MTRPSDFDVNTPAGTASPREGDNELRRIKEFTRNGWLDQVDTDRTAAGRQTHPLFASTLTTSGAASLNSLMLGTTAITATGADLNRTIDLQFFAIHRSNNPLAASVGADANGSLAIGDNAQVGTATLTSVAVGGGARAMGLGNATAIGAATFANGIGSVAVGDRANADTTTASAFGSGAAARQTGCTAIGDESTAGTTGDTTTTDATAVGVDASAAQNNSMALGHEATTTAANHINLGNSSITQINAAVTSITALSDQRDKTDIAELPPALGLEFVNAVTPKEFRRNHRARYNYDDVDGGRVFSESGALFANNEYVVGSKKNTNKSIGFIAQDMEMYLSDNSLDEYKIVAGPETALQMSKTELIGVLWKAVQQLSARVELLENGG